MNVNLLYQLLHLAFFLIFAIWLRIKSNLGGLGVACSPRDPRFACSNPAEVDGFFQNVKILSTIPPGETLGWGSRV